MTQGPDSMAKAFKEGPRGVHLGGTPIIGREKDQFRKREKKIRAGIHHLDYANKRHSIFSGLREGNIKRGTGKGGNPLHHRHL